MKAGKKLIIAMVIISIVPSLIIAFVVNSQMQSSVRDLQRKSLASLANVVSAHIYDFCNGQEMDSLFFAEVTAYRKCLETRGTGQGAEDAAYWEEEVRNLFTDTTVINDNIDGGALIDASGRVLLSYDKAEEGKSVVNTEMYKSIMGGKELYRSTIVNRDGTRNINMVVPVKNSDGEILGMLKRIVNLSNLNLYIDEVEIGDTGYVYVIDENATLVYHGSKDKTDLALGEFQERSELDALLNQVATHTLEEKAGIINYENQGIKTMAAYSQIKELDWVVMVAVDSQEVQGPVDRSTHAIEIVSIMVGLITALACYFTVHALVSPLTQLKERLSRIAEGDHTVRCDSTSLDELSFIIEGVNDIAFRLEKYEEELERAKTHDALTGMYNRTGVMQLIGDRLHAGGKQAILLLDLDEFEVINETMGQNVGDSVLMETAEKISMLPQCVYCAGRFGGDSFVLLVDSWDEENDPDALAVCVRQEIEQIRFVLDRPVHITTSIGIVYIDDSDINLNTYLKRAGIALHKAKKSGKNTDVVFSDEI